MLHISFDSCLFPSVIVSLDEQFNSLFNSAITAMIRGNGSSSFYDFDDSGVDSNTSISKTNEIMFLGSALLHWRVLFVHVLNQLIFMLSLLYNYALPQHLALALRTKREYKTTPYALLEESGAFIMICPRKADISCSS
jgi:hypothetical protein